MVAVRRAESIDAPVILALRHAAEDWLASRSIDQWTPREVPLSTIDSQVARGEFVVGLDPSTEAVVAAMRLVDSDPLIWLDNENAYYVHSLVIDRSHAGKALGAAMLEHAVDIARGAGLDRLRLDCADANTALRSYYRSNGFTELGRREFEDGRWFSVRLFEKLI